MKAEKPRCGILLKGGISSGIVYPRLLSTLSQHYRFAAVGGTSAGAIAASAAAAAEFGVRAQRNPAAFEQLGKLPEELGTLDPATGNTRLFGLFQPSGPFVRPFKMIAGVLKAPAGLERITAAYRLLLRHYPAAALLGATGPATLWWAIACSPSVSALVAIPFLIILSFVMMPLFSGAHMLLNVMKSLPGNQYGMCTGMGDATALTPWLYGYLQRLAGLPADKPLTFGDLENVNNPDAGIEFSVMTVNVSQARAMRLPASSATLLFRPEELRRVLPGCVVDYMEQHPGTAALDPIAGNVARRMGLVKLPDPEHLPIILAVRCSLAFPVLLSAVPLWSTRLVRLADNKFERIPVRSWFTDGGLASNLPQFMYDRLLPEIPVFAVNLDRLQYEGQERTYLPAKPGLGGQFPFSGIDHHQEEENGPIWATFRFLAALLNAAITWFDNSAKNAPGFRDRTMTIRLADSEGGLNISMPPATLKTLAEIGEEAGRKIAAAFNPEDESPQGGWSRFQWTRLRLATALLGQVSAELKCALGDQSISGYGRLLKWTASEAPAYQYLGDPEKAAGHAVLQRVAEAGAMATSSHVNLWAGAPTPKPEYRVVPNY